MGQGKFFAIQAQLNKMLSGKHPNYSFTRENIQSYLDELYDKGDITGWTFYPEAGRWIVFAEEYPDGVWFDWNDKSYPFQEPKGD